MIWCRGLAHHVRAVNTNGADGYDVQIY